MAADTIGDSEKALGKVLASVICKELPQAAGFSLEVEIYERDRKKRRDASRDGWHPGSGEIRIRFGSPMANQASAIHSTADDQNDNSGESELDALGKEAVEKSVSLERLVKALDSAERRPNFDFVALKWFRDSFLPAEVPECANSPEMRDGILRNAIGNRVILTSRVPNPKSPAFPVTAIGLNRQHPDVIAILGAPGTCDLDFMPIQISGEDLSDTVLRERR